MPAPRLKKVNLRALRECLPDDYPLHLALAFITGLTRRGCYGIIDTGKAGLQSVRLVRLYLKMFPRQRRRFFGDLPAPVPPGRPRKNIEQEVEAPCLLDVEDETSP